MCTPAHEAHASKHDPAEARTQASTSTGTAARQQPRQRSYAPSPLKQSASARLPVGLCVEGHPHTENMAPFVEDGGLIFPTLVQSHDSFWRARENVTGVMLSLQIALNFYVPAVRPVRCGIML